MITNKSVLSDQFSTAGRRRLCGLFTSCQHQSLTRGASAGRGSRILRFKSAIGPQIDKLMTNIFSVVIVSYQTTSRESKLTKRPHRHRTWAIQSYLPSGDTVCKTVHPMLSDCLPLL